MSSTFDSSQGEENNSSPSEKVSDEQQQTNFPNEEANFIDDNTAEIDPIHSNNLVTAEASFTEATSADIPVGATRSSVARILVKQGQIFRVQVDNEVKEVHGKSPYSDRSSVFCFSNEVIRRRKLEQVRMKEIMLIDAITIFKLSLCTLLEDMSHLNAWSARRLLVNRLDVSEVTIDKIFSLTIREKDKVFVIDDHPISHISFSYLIKIKQ